MEIIEILKSTLGLGGLALIFGMILGSTFSKFAEKSKEEKQGRIPEDLSQNGEINTAAENELRVCVLQCKGSKEEAFEKYEYIGPVDCRISYVLFNGSKACRYGCQGQGHCVSVCPEKAITMGQNSLPIIDINKCTACGICVKECPRQVLELIPRSQLIYLACKSLDSDKAVKNVCKVGCDACAICITVCPLKEAIVVTGNLPIIDYKKCTSCGICYNKCPTKSFIDRAKARPYAIISLQCDGCGECIKVCQFDAIDGEPSNRHTIIKDRCIGCGRCFEVCPVKVITMAGALGYTAVA